MQRCTDVEPKFFCHTIDSYEVTSTILWFLILSDSSCVPMILHVSEASNTHLIRLGPAIIIVLQTGVGYSE